MQHVLYNLPCRSRNGQGVRPDAEDRRPGGSPPGGDRGGRRPARRGRAGRVDRPERGRGRWLLDDGRVALLHGHGRPRPPDVHHRGRALSRAHTGGARPRPHRRGWAHRSGAAPRPGAASRLAHLVRLLERGTDVSHLRPRAARAGPHDARADRELPEPAGSEGGAGRRDRRAGRGATAWPPWCRASPRKPSSIRGAGRRRASAKCSTASSPWSASTSRAPRADFGTRTGAPFRPGGSAWSCARCRTGRGRCGRRPRRCP